MSSQALNMLTAAAATAGANGTAPAVVAGPMTAGGGHGSGGANTVSAQAIAQTAVRQQLQQHIRRQQLQQQQQQPQQQQQQPQSVATVMQPNANAQPQFGGWPAAAAAAAAVAAAAAAAARGDPKDQQPTGQQRLAMGMQLGRCMLYCIFLFLATLFSAYRTYVWAK